MAERRKLGELLVMAGAIDQSQLAQALSHQRQFGQPLGKILVSLGFIDEEAMIRTLARQLKLPVAWLDGKWVEPQVLELVPAELARKHSCLPLSVSEGAGGKVLHLAMQDPGNLEALDAVGFAVGHKVSPVLCSPSELEEALQRHYETDAGRGGVASNRPEVQDVPELLMFEVKASTPAADLDFNFGPTSGDPALISAHAALRALSRLLSELMGLGIIKREEVAEALRKLLEEGDGDGANELLLDDELELV